MGPAPDQPGCTLPGGWLRGVSGSGPLRVRRHSVHVRRVANSEAAQLRSRYTTACGRAPIGDNDGYVTTSFVYILTPTATPGQFTISGRVSGLIPRRRANATDNIISVNEFLPVTFSDPTVNGIGGGMIYIREITWSSSGYLRFTCRCSPPFIFFHK